jgi:hypothetical protein
MCLLGKRTRRKRRSKAEINDKRCDLESDKLEGTNEIGGNSKPNTVSAAIERISE